MNDEKLLTTAELAEVMRRNKASFYNLLSKGTEGKDYPPCIRMGRKRLWLQSDVFTWLRAKAGNDINRAEAITAMRAKPELNKI